MTHIEYFLALNDEEDFPEITDGPFKTYMDAIRRLRDFSNKEDYVILWGDFPDV